MVIDVWKKKKKKKEKQINKLPHPATQKMTKTTDVNSKMNAAEVLTNKRESGKRKKELKKEE